MWYSSNTEPTKKDEKQKSGLDYKIVCMVAENSIRRALFLKGEYNPDSTRVNVLVKKAANKIKEKYGDFNSIRAATTNESLTPLVNEIVEKLINPC